MAYSFLLNKPIFQLFGKAYNNRLLKELEGVENELGEIEVVDSDKLRSIYGKNVSPDGKLDNSYALQFLNTFLVEGIPGAGKSKAVDALIYKYLNAYHKDLLKNAWVCHGGDTEGGKIKPKFGQKNLGLILINQNSLVKKHILKQFIQDILQLKLMKMELLLLVKMNYRKTEKLEFGILKMLNYLNR